MTRHPTLPILFALLLLGVAQAPPAAAQTVPAPVIAVVDVNEVLRKAKAGLALTEEVENQRAAFERELEAKRADLRKSEEQLRRQQSVLAPEALEQRRRELERKFNDARRQTEERQNQLSRVFNEARGRLNEEMAKSVADVMKGRAVNLVLPRATVLVYDEKLNITPEVIKVLDQRLPRLQLNFAAQPQSRKN